MDDEKQPLLSSSDPGSGISCLIVLGLAIGIGIALLLLDSLTCNDYYNDDIAYMNADTTAMLDNEDIINQTRQAIVDVQHVAKLDTAEPDSSMLQNLEFTSDFLDEAEEAYPYSSYDLTEAKYIAGTYLRIILDSIEESLMSNPNRPDNFEQITEQIDFTISNGVAHPTSDDILAILKDPSTTIHNLRILRKKPNFLVVVCEYQPGSVTDNRWERIDKAFVISIQDSVVSLTASFDGSYSAGLVAPKNFESYISMQPRYSENLRLYLNEWLFLLQEAFTNHSL